MFRNKENLPDMQPLEEKPTRPIETRSVPSVPTQLASGAEIRGDLKAPGSAIIEGRIDGTLIADGDVQIGPKGIILGEVEGKNITISGNVKGKIFADDRVQLLSGAHVEGDIHSASLKIDDSVFFQGGCVMGQGARKRRADDHIQLPSTVRDLKVA